MSSEEAYIYWIETIGALVDDVDRKRTAGLDDRYRLVTRAGDRHGALEWTFYSTEGGIDGLDRLVSVAVVPESMELANVEFIFGGRLGDRSTVHVARSSLVKASGLDPFVGWLEDAVEQANTITKRDLSEAVEA